MCKICIARCLVVDIFPWCNANFVPFPSRTLVARRMQNGRIETIDDNVQKMVSYFYGKIVRKFHWHEGWKVPKQKFYHALCTISKSAALFLINNVSWSKLYEKLKNGNKNLVGQAVLVLLIKICFDQRFNAIFEILRQFAWGCFLIFPRNVVDFEIAYKTC